MLPMTRASQPLRQARRFCVAPMMDRIIFWSCLFSVLFRLRAFAAMLGFVRRIGRRTRKCHRRDHSRCRIL